MTKSTKHCSRPTLSSSAKVDILFLYNTMVSKTRYIRRESTIQCFKILFYLIINEMKL